MSTAIIFVCPSNDPLYTALLTLLLTEDYPDKKIFPKHKNPFTADFYIIDETIQEETFLVASKNHNNVFEICVIMPFEENAAIQERMFKQIRHGNFFMPQNYDDPTEAMNRTINFILKNSI